MYIYTVGRGTKESKKSNDCNNVDSSGPLLFLHIASVSIFGTDNKEFTVGEYTLYPTPPLFFTCIMLDQPAGKKGSAIAKIPAPMIRLLEHVLHFNQRKNEIPPFSFFFFFSKLNIYNTNILLSLVKKRSY